jgi:hypothetical protein
MSEQQPHFITEPEQAYSAVRYALDHVMTSWQQEDQELRDSGEEGLPALDIEALVEDACRPAENGEPHDGIMLEAPDEMASLSIGPDFTFAQVARGALAGLFAVHTRDAFMGIVKEWKAAAANKTQQRSE